MSKARPISLFALAAGLVGLSAAPAEAVSFADRQPSLVRDVQLGYERGAGAEAYAPQELTADHPQIERYYARLKGQVSPQVGLWLQLGRGSYQFDDLDFPGTRHLRHETQVVAGLSRDGDFFGGTWSLGAGYGVSVLQVQSSARLADAEPSFFFLPWQTVHGVTLSESIRMGLGPVGLVVDGHWSPYLFAHLADGRLSMPGYLTSFRVAPRVTLWEDRLSVGVAFEKTMGSGFDRQSMGPFAALRVGGF